MSRWTITAGTVLACWLGVCAPASAELVFFAGDRTLSVAGHRAEGGTVVLMLRGGGEVECDRGLIVRIAPDEVPYQDSRRDAMPPPAWIADERYAAIIEQACARQGVDPRLAKAVIQVESGYEAAARSPKGALGLMQLMPQTARQYGVQNPLDPAANVEAGVRHLRLLLDRFELPLALAAYNAGQAAVERFRGIPPYAETRDYVSRVLSLLDR
jgi:soluble lytic murein transglycosylase-like protein